MITGRYRRRLAGLLLIGLMPISLLLAACVDLQDTEGGDVLFSEQFFVGQTGSWLLESDEAGQTAVVDGQLAIEINTPQTMQFATLTEPTFDDFVLEVDVVQLAGDRESSYGLLFRMQDERHFYRFDMTGHGLFIVEKHSEELGWTRLTGGWVATPAIQQGLETPNRLKVVARGRQLTFFINDQLVQQLEDDSYAQGAIGLDAGTFARAGLRVAFDNLVVRQ